MANRKILWWLAASAACLGLLVFAWKSHMAEEVIWMGTFIACMGLPAWAMFLDDDNAEG